MGEIENSPNNCASNSNSLYGYNASERYDYSPNHVPLSEFVPKNPTMFHNPQVNSQLAGLGNGLNGDPNDHDMDGSAAPPVGASPYNGSKSLVTGKRGFSPFFKSQAVSELLTHCTHQLLLTKALTVQESYEAVAICRLVAVHSSGLPGTLAKLVWIPMRLRSATLPDLKAWLQFLVGKAAQTPSADQWKHWSGGYNKVYVSKNQKKK